MTPSAASRLYYDRFMAVLPAGLIPDVMCAGGALACLLWERSLTLGGTQQIVCVSVKPAWPRGPPRPSQRYVVVGRQSVRIFSCSRELENQMNQSAITLAINGRGDLSSDGLLLLL